MASAMIVVAGASWLGRLAVAQFNSAMSPASARTDSATPSCGIVTEYLALDRSTYLRGQPVLVTAQIVNKGLQPCLAPNDLTVEILNSSGEPVLGSVVHSDAALQPNWNAGTSLERTWIWRQKIPSGGDAVPGRYTLRIAWRGARWVTTTFRILPIPQLPIVSLAAESEATSCSKPA